jgi:hypothetical protein
LRLKDRYEAGVGRAKSKQEGGTDLFISYSRQDVETIKALAAVLKQHGWSVWFDEHLQAGASFDRVIEQALTKAQAVIVAWSKNSVNSDWVRAEAAFAQESGKLLPIRLDGTPLPLRFTHVHTLGFSNWDGSASHQALQALDAHLREAIGRPGVGT